MKKRGFTLVELLVVIAIIAILAAMIMPVLLQVKDSARMRVCAAGMRQLGAAVCRYIDDNSGYGLPAAPMARYPKVNPWVMYVEPLIPGYLSQSIAPFLKSANELLPIKDCGPSP